MEYSHEPKDMPPPRLTKRNTTSSAHTGLGAQFGNWLLGSLFHLPPYQKRSQSGALGYLEVLGGAGLPRSGGMQPGGFNLWQKGLKQVAFRYCKED